MRSLGCSVGSEWPPKLLGTYELELAEVIEEVVIRSYPRILNVGAGEGYYAVGLTLRCPESEVICFETDPRGQRLISRLAGLNGVENRIRVCGSCTIESLRRTIVSSDRTLILCDAEGDEFTLLRPETLGMLRRIDVLVELHEFVHRGIGNIIKARFAASHQIREITARPRSVTDLPPSIRLPPRFVPLLLSEERPDGMSWLWMKARRGDCSTPIQA